jgi:replicative DNA helicase
LGYGFHPVSPVATSCQQLLRGGFTCLSHAGDASVDPLFLPQSSSVEREVLACLLLEPELMPSVWTRLSCESFHNEVNRFIWDGMTVAFQRHNTFDEVILKEVLTDLGTWGRVGGGSIVSLLDRSGSVSHINTYVDRLVGMCGRRSMWHASKELGSIAIDGNLSPDEAITEAEALVGRLRMEGEYDTDGDDAADVVSDYMKMVHAIQRGEKEPPRISTGLYPLDKALGGGFRPGWLVLVMSLNGHGKTALAVNGFAWAVAQQGRPALIVSLEMPPDQIIGRLISAESGIPVQVHDQKGLSEDHLVAMTHAAQKVSSAPIRIVGHQGATIDALRQAARAYKAERGDLGIIVVDYIQLMRSQSKSSNRTEELERISRGLKELAMELDCVVVSISQPTMAAKRTKERPTIRDSKGSGAIDDDADLGLVPWLLHNVDENANPWDAEIGMDKFRHGPRRNLYPSDIEWDGSRTRFITPSGVYRG